MPKVNGFEVIEYMKLKNYDIPKIIVTTASILSDEKNICISKGIQQFIEKPFQLNNIKNVLDNLLKKL